MNLEFVFVKYFVFQKFLNPSFYKGSIYDQAKFAWLYRLVTGLLSFMVPSLNRELS